MLKNANRHWLGWENAVLLLSALLFMGSLNAASLRGKVNGLTPLSGVKVHLIRDGRELQEVTSDTHGEFRIDNIAPGSYQLLLLRFPYPPVEKIIAVAENGEIEIEITLGSLQESVTVTAERMISPSATATSRVEVLAMDEIRSMPQRSIEERLREFPEFSLFRRSSSLVSHPTTQGVSLRGIGPSGVSRSLLLVDGVPQNDAFGGWVYWNRIPPLSLQRVEIANGAGTGLHGNYSLGGVVQMIRRRPEAAVAEVQGSLGNDESLKGDVYLSHRLGNWGFSLATSLLDFGGYVVVDERQAGKVDIPSGSEHQSLRVVSEWQWGSVLWSLEAGILHEDRNTGTPLSVNNTDSHDFSASLFWSPTGQDHLQFRSFFRRTIFESNFTAVAQDRNSERMATQQHVPTADGGFSATWLASRGRQAMFSGIDFWRVSGIGRDAVFFGPRVGLIRVGGGEQSTIGFFAQDVIRWSSRLEVTLGGRLDWWRNINGRRGSAPPATPTEFQGIPDRSETVFSPRVGVSYRLAEATILYGSVYRSFRAPTLNELYREFRVGNVVTNANSNLKTESLNGGETGIRFQWSDALRIEVGAFLNSLDRPVANVTLETTPALVTRQRQNLGEVRVRGFQASAQWLPMPEVKLEGRYLLDRSRVETGQVQLFGKRLPQVPEHRMTLSVDVALWKSTRLSLTGRYVGSQFDDDLNTLLLDDYSQLDLYLARGFGDSMRAFLAMENLTDTRIIVNRSPVDFIGTPFQIRAGIDFQLR
ncbi:MAG: TonB-dependent receptor [Acidobacteria bacterium]|nr:TonB-dependent receptor [Acidobacteriota bacterium]